MPRRSPAVLLGTSGGGPGGAWASHAPHPPHPQRTSAEAAAAEPRPFSFASDARGMARRAAKAAAGAAAAEQQAAAPGSLRKPRSELKPRVNGDGGGGVQKRRAHAPVVPRSPMLRTGRRAASRAGTDGGAAAAEALSRHLQQGAAVGTTRPPAPTQPA
eukprot:121596-Chlamydomonas_euryale.AAC.2